VQRWARRAGNALVACLVALAAGAPAASARADDDARPLTSAEVAARWHGRLDGRHFSARVRMSMDLAGLREERVLRVFRDDQDGRGERVSIRFDAPPDLRNVSLLYLAHEGRPNDYFLYQPSARRIRRLPAAIADDDVYGIDLEFLGFGVAQVTPTRIESSERETLNGREVWKLVELATQPNPRFEKRVTWIDARSFVALRTEHRRGGNLVLSAEAQGLGSVQGVTTPERMRFHKPIEHREVLLEVVYVDYQAPIPDEHFTALSLIKSQTHD
jgi:hypothetical protein